jgi:peroxiredoxin
MPYVKKYYWLLLFFVWHSSFAQVKNDSVFQSSLLSAAPLFDITARKITSVPVADPSGKLRLFVFLSPECPLCQNYTKTLNALNKQYAGRIQCYGIIPGKTYKNEEVAAFTEKYKITYPVLIDASLRFSHYLQAAVTPEVILLTPGNELIYKGAIDNWLKDLGKPQAKISANYLQDAISRALKHESPAIKRTKAVGCMINDF